VADLDGAYNLAPNEGGRALIVSTRGLGFAWFIDLRNNPVRVGRVVHDERY
jgi:hypothetical protein